MNEDNMFTLLDRAEDDPDITALRNQREKNDNICDKINMLINSNYEQKLRSAK